MTTLPEHHCLPDFPPSTSPSTADFICVNSFLSRCSISTLRYGRTFPPHHSHRPDHWRSTAPCPSPPFIDFHIHRVLRDPTAHIFWGHHIRHKHHPHRQLTFSFFLDPATLTPLPIHKNTLSSSISLRPRRKCPIPFGSPMKFV